MSAYRVLPPEVLEMLGIEPEDEEPDQPTGPYEIPGPPTDENAAPEGWSVRDADQPGGPAQ